MGRPQAGGCTEPEGVPSRSSGRRCVADRMWVIASTVTASTSTSTSTTLTTRCGRAASATVAPGGAWAPVCARASRTQPDLSDPLPSGRYGEVFIGRTSYAISRPPACAGTKAGHSKCQRRPKTDCEYPPCSAALLLGCCRRRHARCRRCSPRPTRRATRHARSAISASEEGRSPTSSVPTTPSLRPGSSPTQNQSGANGSTSSASPTTSPGWSGSQEPCRHRGRSNGGEG